MKKKKIVRSKGRTGKWRKKVGYFSTGFTSEASGTELLIINHK
jgi:hypothetical protein